MSALVLARDFPGSASEFERRNVYVPCLVFSGIKRPIYVSSNYWLSKFTSTFVLALVKEKLPALNSLIPLYTKIFEKQSKPVKKMLTFLC